MLRRFADRVVLVTGGASGIGAASSAAFAAEGARVVVADVDRERGPQVADAIGGRFEWVDVADDAQTTRLVAGTAQAFERLDVLVPTAFSTAFGSIESLGFAEWTRTIDVTLNAIFTALRAAIPIMKAQGSGAIVTVASISGLAADRGLAAYNAAKAGVVNLTRTAALELARPGIRVNAV